MDDSSKETELPTQKFSPLGKTFKIIKNRYANTLITKAAYS